MLFNEDTFCENHEEISVEKSPLELQFDKCHGDFFGPALPPHLLEINAGSKEQGTIYGPSLSNNFREKKEDKLSEVSATVLKGNDKVLIGPEIPEHLISKPVSLEIEDSTSVHEEEINVGPSMTLMATEDAVDCYKFLNSQNLHKKTVNVIESKVKRESWMTELPEKKRAAFSLLRRHFKPQTQTEKESDDSVWTDTPANIKEKETTDFNKIGHNEILRAKRLEERDKEMEKLAKKAAKKLKREQSLLEIHLKRMKKRKKKERRKQKKEGALLPERRPFDRNTDLQIFKYDETQKRATFDRSQFLKNRFAPGQSKFL